MRCVVLSVSPAALVCLIMAILQVHAVAIIPPEAPPERLRILEADDALPDPSPGAVDIAPHSGSGLAGSLPVGVSSIPTETRVLPSHAPWHVQPAARPASPLQGTQQWTFGGRTRDSDTEDDVDSAMHPYEDSSSNSAPWADSAKHRDRDREVPSPRRRRQPGDVGADGSDSVARDQYARTSDDSKMSVLALAVVGVILACHYLDYL
ncbi:hypothetical protein GSI_03488 [Ganoderma sinense ZZ0214-1]|uniref:Transporter n=1 Tax=Ganoderma sinense ZZ0214-1 TaxID=1077348 RepID=A0A2G8SMA6_9APHY|nr:hypothetical protein GSI_03488 [Ganoderma sinense ZZ0214-1]